MFSLRNKDINFWYALLTKGLQFILIYYMDVEEDICLILDLYSLAGLRHQGRLLEAFEHKNQNFVSVPNDSSSASPW